jgi:excisionase family DNA binding protein
MGRPRKRSIFPIALSVDAAAEALSLPRRRLVRAIEAGELIGHSEGPRKRVLITVQDLIAWIKSWPRATKRRSPQ